MTKLGMRRTSPQKPLKRYTPLRARTMLKRMSKKQIARTKTLAKLKPPSDGLCEECHQKADWRGLAKHHKVFRSHNGNDTADNILWLCGKCHSLYHNIREQ